MNETNFSFKELYELKLKATYPIEIGNRTIESGEVIAYFDRVMLSNFREVSSLISAHGGWDNRGLVFWETVKEIQLSFTQGIFNQEQFALLSGAQLIDRDEDSITITNRELLESDENCQIELKEIPSGNLFIYTATGTKLTYQKISDKVYKIATAYTDVIVDYEYNYENEYDCITVGQKVLNGYIQLEGRTKIKEDGTGTVRTGIIKIPKLKVVSDLSMRLGREASPVAGSFNAIALPTGSRGNSTVMDILFLDDDIDSDI